MAIGIYTIKCPECGASLDVEEGRKNLFCSYCGSKVMINNENEHIYRHIDEARIKEAEIEREIKLKQMEIESEDTFSKKKISKNLACCDRSSFDCWYYRQYLQS